MIHNEPLITCLAPAELSAERLESLACFIKTYGAVPPGRIRHNLENSFRIIWAESDGQLLGTSCLKQPRPAYLKKLGVRMGFTLEGFLERGYTCVRKEAQGEGIATSLITQLTEIAGQRPFYVLVQEGNPALQKILQTGTELKVKVFYSKLANKKLEFWVSAEAACQLGIRA